VIEGSGYESDGDNEDLRIASESLESTLDRMGSLNCLNQSEIFMGMVSNSIGPKGLLFLAMHEGELGFPASVEEIWVHC
jgi:hypothetical protein